MGNSLKQSLFYQSLYQILLLILPFVTSPYVSRIFGAEGIGVFAYTNTIAAYFALFADLGIKNHGIRAIAKVKNDCKKLNEVFSELLVLHVFFTVIVLFLYVFYVVKYGRNVTIELIQGLLIVSCLFDVTWFYFGIENFKLTVKINLLCKITSVMCVFLFVNAKDDIWLYCFISGIGVLLSQILLWFPLKYYVCFVKPSYLGIFNQIKPLLVLFVPVVAVSLYKYMDKIMIAMFSDVAQLGLFENAEKIANVPVMFISSFGVVMISRITSLITEGNVLKVDKYTQLSIKYIMIASLALTFGIGAISDEFSILFWGKEFEKTGDIIEVLILAVPFIAFANIIRTQHLIPLHKDKEYIVSVFLGALVNLGFNYILIPQYGAIGAAYATLIAEIVVCVTQICSTYSITSLWIDIKSFYIFFIPGAVMYLFIKYLEGIMQINIVALLIHLISGALIYISLTVTILYCEQDEILMNGLKKIKIEK